MRLERVRIQNYRSIKDADFQPTDLCALIGGNNCGKSNILRAINLVLGDRWPSVRSLDDKDFHGYDESQDIVISIWFDEAREVRGDVGDPVSFHGVQFTATRYKRASGRNRKGDLRGQFVCIDNEGKPVEVLKFPPRTKARPHPQPANVSEAIRSALPAVMVDVDRNARHHLSGSQWSILGRMLNAVSKQLKSDRKRYTAFQEKFQEARELLRTDDFNQLHSQIVENLEAHTGISGVEITLDEIDPINLYKSFSILFRDPETPHPVDAERMGSGIQSAVVISLLQAYRELHKDNAILLFEEPELFLHPHGRRHLFRLLCELADDGTQVIYTTHSQDFVDLSRMDCVQLTSKNAAEGTRLAPPTDIPISTEWRQRLKQIRQFSSPRNEIFFAESVVLVEGTTEIGAISVLSEMMPESLDFDRLNCSIIEVNGKDNLPLFIKMTFALGKRVLAIYDTDSDKADPNDKATNEKKNQAIVDAMDGRGELFACDPYFENIAGITEGSKKEKEAKVREHLSGFSEWNDVPGELQNMMQAVSQDHCELGRPPRMTNDTKKIVDKAWNFAHVLRDDGLSYMAYTEQITFLLFLKMADEQIKPPYNRKPIVPAKLGWQSLLERDGDELEVHYRHILEELGRKSGMLGAIFKKARQEIQNPATLRRLIVDLIDTESWSSMQADVKGDIYEGLLAKSAAESPKGAGQYFTPRQLIQAIVDCVQPTPNDTLCDPACGTGGFLLAAHQYVIDHHGKELDPDEKKHLRRSFVHGWELVPNTARLCVMNLYLHGIDADPCPIQAGMDALATDPGERYSVVMTNPPFGKKSSIAVVNEEGELEKEDTAYERQDFWTTTKNKQLNFLQHVRTLLKINGHCAIVVPDNVLFEGGAGETVRRNLLQQCDVHTLLRLPTGIFYAQGVKANVLFFDAKPAQEKAWTKKLWVYDLRTNMHFTLKTNPLKRSDLDEFVKCYKPGKLHNRKPTWAEDKPEGRWRSFTYDEITKRDKANLDIFWLKDKSLEDSEDLPEPDVLAQEIADDLQTALDQFAAIAGELKE